MNMSNKFLNSNHVSPKNSSNKYSSSTSFNDIHQQQYISTSYDPNKHHHMNKNTFIKHQQSKVSENRLFSSSTQKIDQNQYTKLMHLMRQQIQIGTNFYNNKINILMKQQAKQIMVLGAKIKENQAALREKQNMIDKLQKYVRNNIKESPKKKLSLTTYHVQYREEIATLTEKIDSLQKQISAIRNQFSLKQKNQFELNKKIENLSKGMTDIFASRLASCHRKLEKYISKKEKQIEKVYGQVSQIQSNLFKPQNSEIAIIKMKEQIAQFNHNLHNFATKTFTYQNQQINNLSVYLSTLKQKISILQKQLQQPSSSNKLTSSHLKCTKITRNQSNQDLTISNHSQLIHKSHKASISSKALENGLVKKSISSTQQLVPKSLQQIMSQTSYDPRVQESRNKKVSEKLFRNIDNYEDVESFTDNEDQEYLYAGEQEDNSYYENYNDQYMDEQIVSNENRLRQVIQNMGHKMPLKVEIDQTGYLKCYHDGMYIVDENHDGFYLDQQEIQACSAMKIIQIMK